MPGSGERFERMGHAYWESFTKAADLDAPPRGRGGDRRGAVGIAGVMRVLGMVGVVRAHGA